MPVQEISYLRMNFENKTKFEEDVILVAFFPTAFCFSQYSHLTCK